METIIKILMDKDNISYNAAQFLECMEVIMDDPFRVDEIFADMLGLTV